MTAQAPYESLTTVEAVQKAQADGRTVELNRAPRWEETNLRDEKNIAAFLRIGAEFRAALPERAPVSAGGDAVAWQARFEGGAWMTVSRQTYDAVQARDGWETRVLGVLATPAPPVGAWDRRGGTIYLDREEAGIVVDALIDHRENAEQRKGKNFASSSDYRANKCAELIGRLNTESAAPTPAEARGVGEG